MTMRRLFDQVDASAVAAEVASFIHLLTKRKPPPDFSSGGSV